MSALTDLMSDLANEASQLKHSRLLQLSGLTSEELNEFESVWGTVPGSRKREILERLVGLGEDNLELDFSAVFLVGTQDDEADVRERSALGLWESDDRAVIRPLIKLLIGDASTSVRAAAAISIGKFAELAQNGKLISRDCARIQEALLAVIKTKEDDVGVRRRAIEALACFDYPETDEIIREAHGSGDLRLKQSALYAMGRSSNAQWLPTVLEELDDDDPHVRYEATNAAGQLGEEATVPHLIKLVEDDDWQVQLAAVRALGNVGGSLAKLALQKCLSMDDEALEPAVQDALNNIEFDDDPLRFSFNS